MRIIIFLLLAVVANPTFLLAEEPQYWPQAVLRTYDDGFVTSDLFLQTRFEDGLGDLRQTQVSERVAFRLDPRLTTSFNYAYFHSFAKANQDTRNDHRFEWELNPETQLSSTFRYKTRNRIEFLYDDHFALISPRFRHRSNIEYWREGWLNTIFTGVEFFYGVKEEHWNQFRYVPLGLRMKLENDVQLSLQPFLQLLRDDGDWKPRVVFQFELFWNFGRREEPVS